MSQIVPDSPARAFARDDAGGARLSNARECYVEGFTEAGEGSHKLGITGKIISTRRFGWRRTWRLTWVILGRFYQNYTLLEPDVDDQLQQRYVPMSRRAESGHLLSTHNYHLGYRLEVRHRRKSPAYLILNLFTKKYISDYKR